jgi:hypothetical protein
MHGRCNALLLATCLFCTSLSVLPQAKETWSEGDKGYKLGCSVQSKVSSPCNDACGELWTEKESADRHSRCEKEKADKRKKAWDCQSAAYSSNSKRQVACIKQEKGVSLCLDQSSKQLSSDLDQCK